MKKIVYIPTKVEDELPEVERGDTKETVFAISDCNSKFIANTIRFGGLSDDSDYPDFAVIWLKKQEMIVFTPDEFDKFTEIIAKELNIDYEKISEIIKKYKI